MVKPPGDLRVAKLFGFPGFEAFIRITMKYVNELRTEQGNPLLTYDEYRDEIEVEMIRINNEPV